jgi:predicted transcriptional regulator of viral defense system
MICLIFWLSHLDSSEVTRIWREITSESLEVKRFGVSELFSVLHSLGYLESIGVGLVRIGQLTWEKMWKAHFAENEESWKMHNSTSNPRVAYRANWA